MLVPGASNSINTPQLAAPIALLPFRVLYKPQRKISKLANPCSTRPFRIEREGEKFKKKSIRVVKEEDVTRIAGRNATKHLDNAMPPCKMPLRHSATRSERQNRPLKSSSPTSPAHSLTDPTVVKQGPSNSSRQSESPLGPLKDPSSATETFH
ncbi:hypothetical protein CEXT_645701 [Caerostris extrusa]|uniref:Uncharacterized protein n=1 Tax=Caerostris extrusa TaxID=172846 RepID=A0AAV4YA97_CAEEX|nr:hypothetical protein CEXT_645701 [Caerostris extrusa]